MRILINPGNSNCVIATIAIGKQFLNDWERFAKPSWETYCKKHSLGLIVFEEDLIDKQNKFWKKPTWQTTLIGDSLRNSNLNIKNVCVLDGDIIINPFAPNVFSQFDEDTIGLVSLRKNLPYPYNQTLRRIAFLRNRYYSSDYPLDSSLFISTKELYEFHNFEPQEDEACSGFFVFNVENHSDFLKSIFFKYTQNINTITGGGEQTHINYEIQKNSKVSWFDYKFQALWIYEMAWKYPFLYHNGQENNHTVRLCVEASIFTNYFLHFAGSWHEGDMWKIDNILQQKDIKERFEKFNEYLKMPVSGKPIGQIKPTNK